MASIGEHVKTFMDDYKAASPAIRNELFKWESIRDEIRKFDEGVAACPL